MDGHNVDIGEDNLKLYGRLHASYSDIFHANYCAKILLKKNMHGWPWSRRGTIYLQQKTFTTSLVVSYCRPFTRSKGWPNFPKEILNYDAGDWKLHESLLTTRHQIYAHSDSASYNFQPVSWPAIDTVITQEPAFRLPSEDATRLCSMAAKVLPRIQERMTELFAHKSHDI